jgi:hypothetical protein
VYQPRAAPDESRGVAEPSTADADADAGEDEIEICEMLATESFLKPATFARSGTFPGEFAQLRLLVNSTQTMVVMRLRLNAGGRQTLGTPVHERPEPRDVAR